MLQICQYDCNVFQNFNTFLKFDEKQPEFSQNLTDLTNTKCSLVGNAAGARMLSNLMLIQVRDFFSGCGHGPMWTPAGPLTFLQLDRYSLQGAVSESPPVLAKRNVETPSCGLKMKQCTI